jgi:phenylacetaldehyde dehydrogenase
VSTQQLQADASTAPPVPGRLLIGGEWIEARSGETFATVDPATEETITDVARAGADDVDRAVRAARAAFAPGSPWRRTTPAQRSALMLRLADLIEANADELARLESRDNGKPWRVARDGDVEFSLSVLRYMAGWATKLEGATIPTSMPGAFHAYTLREPIGVVGQIIPWNFPLLMAVFKLAPALTVGCTMVLKPAEQTPLTALRLGELVTEAGFPGGVVNVVTGFGDAGAALAAHPLVDKIAFTGSTEVGKHVVEAAAGNLKKLTLELGGKSPNIVFADADLEVAVAGAAHAVFFNHGQCCTAGSRLYVERPVFEEVVAGVSAAAERIRIGPGSEDGSEMGPLISDEQFAKVLGYVEAGQSSGASVRTGGGRVGERGFFVAPTVFTDTRADMSIVREEIFGPVVVAIPFDSEDEVVASANDTRYGLAAAVWSRDIGRAHRTAAALEAGMVFLNCYHADGDGALPRGGYKESGWGRELGVQGLDDYLQTKAVIAQL